MSKIEHTYILIKGFLFNTAVIDCRGKTYVILLDNNLRRIR